MRWTTRKLRADQKKKKLFEKSLVEYACEYITQVPLEIKYEIASIIEKALLKDSFGSIAMELGTYEDEYMEIFNVKKKVLPKDVNRLFEK